MIIPPLIVALVLPYLPQVAGIWPFQQRRFATETLINAGPLGLDGLDGRVVAVADWNGDQNTDLIVLSADSRLLTMYLWNRNLFRYFSAVEYKASSTIINIIPTDFDQDGRLDLLLMYGGEKHGWWGGEADSTGMEVILGAEGGTFGDKWEVPASAGQQALLLDIDGSLRPSLLGYTHVDYSSTKDQLTTWLNNGKSLQLSPPPFQNPEQACTLANPHSSAYIDIDGDCVPDIVLHCSSAKTKAQSIQIWLNKGKDGYSLAKTYDLPKGTGPLTFADMDRDGTMDIVFPVCSKVSASTGQGSDCSINIAYNRQVPICSSEEPLRDKEGNLECRGWGQLCTSDPGFSFIFTESSSGDDSSSPFSAPLSDILGLDVSLLLHPPGKSHITLPLRPGDYDIDGYPDLLFTIINSTAKTTGGVFGTKEGTQARILRNVPCRKGLPGCGGKGQERTFVLGQGKGWEALDEIWDVAGASWLDVDDDGSLDIMVQRSGDQGAGKISFIQNNFYHDAFFLKSRVLGGVCDGDCILASGGKSYSSTGTSYAGATYKFTVLDTLGNRRAQQVAQTPQSGHHSLGLPFAYIGLGRTNNYIERLSVGIGSRVDNITNLDSIIPNSHLIINPPFPFPDPSTPSSADQVIKNRPTEWRTELYLHPGDWVPYVAAAVLGTVIILAGVVFGLHEREKKEDEKERRRALHAINFQAL